MFLNIIFYMLIIAVIADKQIFNDTVEFMNMKIIGLNITNYGLVNNITYNVKITNKYNGMIILKFPRFWNIIGANEISGVLDHRNLTCEFVCSRGWTTSGLNYVEFDSYNVSKVSYWIEVDYNRIDDGLLGIDPAVIVMIIIGIVIILITAVYIGCYIKRSCNKKVSYHKV